MTKKSDYFPLSRRTLLVGCGLAFFHVNAPVLANTVVSEDSGAINNNKKTNQRQVYIFQDKALFDTTSTMTPYVSPSTWNGNNKQYIESLSQKEFLTRHWFV